VKEERRTRTGKIRSRRKRRNGRRRGIRIGREVEKYEQLRQAHEVQV